MEGERERRAWKESVKGERGRRAWKESVVLRFGKSQVEATWTESCEQASNLRTTAAKTGGT